MSEQPEADTPSADDPLVALTATLETADQQPVGDRVATFERANEVLTRELAALDEV